MELRDVPLADGTVVRCRLSGDLHDVVLVGHSMGGVVAYLVALRQPSRVARLVVEDAVPPSPVTAPCRSGPLASSGSTLLVGGGPASHLPQDLLSEVCAAVPDCTVVTVPVGHDVHESAPDAFAETVLGWLGSGRIAG